MLSHWDLILSPVFLFVIFFISSAIKNKNITSKPEYKYYSWGLLAKIIGGISLTLVYIFYYTTGGDTLSYFHDGSELNKLFFDDPQTYFRILFTGLSTEDSINLSSTYNFHYGHDVYAFFVSRLTSLFLFVTFRNIIPTVILFAWLSYLGIWKLYLLFSDLYPKYYKYLSIGVLFIPSVFFWGSGILKDTITLSATAWYTFNFYKVFIKKEQITKNLILLIINAFLILSIKPYIIVAILPGSILWLSYNPISAIKNKIIKVLIAPFLVIVGVFLGIYFINIFGDSLGKYSDTRKLIKTAKITQQDLIRSEQYGKNFHNIGEFDESITGILGKSPEAVIAGLYRPFIWESNNIVMLISGVENLLFLLLTIFLLLKFGPAQIFKIISREPIIFFSIVFSIIFAFSVGLSTANFGALVRYRIPALPFFINGLILVYCFCQEIKKKKDMESTF
ncbi:MAG: hypothetical protein HXX09_14890 [Bacteroidetes bacterium]|nr:hypothetical protein [Bacteroidota bacterium]